MKPCESTGEEVSFKQSHHRILSTDSKVRTTLCVSIIDSGIERVKKLPFSNAINKTILKATKQFFNENSAIFSLLNVKQIQVGIQKI